MISPTSPLARFEGVIFDFDDTLVRTWQAKWAQHKAVAKRFYGRELTDAVLREHWGKAYDETLRRYYDNADSIENMRAAKLTLEDEYPVLAQPGAHRLVKRLARNGVPMGVLSSSRSELVRRDLQRLGFALNDFVAVQGSDQTSAYKPDPAVFDSLRRAFAQRRATRLLYVGDSIADYRAASGAGLEFLGICTGLTTLARFNEAGAETVFPDMMQVEKWLFRTKNSA